MTLAVIGFAMGNWIGGTYTYTGIAHLPALGHRLSVIAPGIDVATILENIADLGPYYEQVVLVGYPPFVKDVLDQAPPAVTDMDVKILMAGEHISEGWRDYILKRIGKEGRAEHTCLIYGTADAALGRRTDIAATFYSLKIFPESVPVALEDAAVSEAVSGKFYLVTHADEAYGQTLGLHVELRADVTADESLCSGSVTAWRRARPRSRPCSRPCAGWPGTGQDGR